VLSIESGTENGCMSVDELTSLIDRNQSAHSVTGVLRAFVTCHTPVRPVRPQSYAGPAPVRPAHSVKPSTPRFNPGTSGAAPELPPRGNSGHTFFPRKHCFECGSTTHFRHNCPELLGKTKLEANVNRVGVGILQCDMTELLKGKALLCLCVSRVTVITVLRRCLRVLFHQ